MLSGFSRVCSCDCLLRLSEELSAADSVIWFTAVDDEFTLRSAIERYEDIDNSFGGTREHNLLIVSIPDCAT